MACNMTGMAVIKRVTDVRVRFGGEEHSGWLPPGAAKPLPTPIEEVVVDLEIQSDGPGFLLCCEALDGRHSSDTWHASLAEALEAAREFFGIEPHDWVPAG